MSRRWKIFACGVAVILSLYAGGCDQQKEADEAAAKQLAQQAASDAADAVELKLMSDPTASELEIERRISDFVSVTDGLLIIKETRSNPAIVTAWHAMPLSASWVATCSKGRLHLALGMPDEEGKGYVGRRLTRARLPEEHCQRLMRAAGRSLVRITKSP